MAPSDEPRDPSVVVRAAVEVLVFAPLGLGVKLVEDAPDAVDKARRELSNARFIGRIAVTQGIKEARSRLETPDPKAARSNDAAPDDAPDGSQLMLAEEPVRSIHPTVTDVSADDLALPDYDTLPAIDIVAKLETLEPPDRDAIERYESANRQRRTVLGKLAQLAER